MKQTIKKIALLAICLFASFSMMAQVTTSSISGKITDTNKEEVAGATVVAIHTPSGTQYYSIADSKGNYRILNILPGGPYNIVVEMLGYRKTEVTGVNVALADNFVAVTPTGTAKRSATAATLSGIRTSLAHLHEGHPLSFFPSGAVSDLHLWRGEISDREWQEGLIRLIQRANVPVIPIHFEGRNSLFYYLLGLVDWRVRLLRLPREIFNKRKGHHRVVIGEVITPDQIAACATIGELTAKLRKAVYDMPNPTHFTPASKLHTKE